MTKSSRNVVQINELREAALDDQHLAEIRTKLAEAIDINRKSASRIRQLRRMEKEIIERRDLLDAKV